MPETPNPGGRGAARPAERLARVVGRRLRELREARGRTLGDVAAEAGVTPPFLSLLERGGRSASLETLWELAATLRVPVADLLRGGGEAPPAPIEPLARFVVERNLRKAEVARLAVVLRAFLARPR